MKPKKVYIVVPHHWDTLWGDIVVFSTLEKAQRYVKKSDQDVQYSIEVRYIDYPKKREKKIVCKDCGKEWNV